jgi:hypothetical protein
MRPGFVESQSDKKYVRLEQFLAFQRAALVEETGHSGDGSCGQR